MNGLLFFAVSLLAICQVLATEPVVCGRLPAVYTCLRTPNIVKRSVAAQCNRDLPECEKITCIFTKSGWMNGDQIDKPKITAYFEEFGSENPEWQTAVDRVKVECIEKNLLPQSIHLNCPAFDITHCSFSTFLKNAQESLWSTTKSCAEARRFVASCPICPSDCFEPQIPIGSCNACVALPRLT